MVQTIAQHRTESHQHLLISWKWEAIRTNLAILLTEGNISVLGGQINVAG